MHGHFLPGIVFSGIHIIVAAGGLYLLYNISKSLKCIAGSLDKIEQENVK